MPPPGDILSEAANLFVFVDEAHRTQYKSLAANMRKALPSACFLGFTGTPIDKNDRSTSRVFGPYIHTYTIQRALQDGATVPIYNESRLPELRVEGETLDAVFGRVFQDRSEKERMAIKNRYATLEAIAGAPKRIERICLDLIDHFEKFIYPNGFKSQVVVCTCEADPVMSSQKATVHFGTPQFDYHLSRSERKRTVSIAVDPVEGVLVTAPRDAEAGRVHEIVLRKARWIADRLHALGEVDGDVSAREFVSGESFPYLGRNHRLKVIPSAGAEISVQMLGGRFEVVVDSRLPALERNQAIRMGLCRWYQEHAATRIAERVAFLSPRFGVISPSILIREQQKRWASCDRQGRIRFNWQIIMAPMSLVDYVVAHELCHLICHDHSPAFWKLLRAIMSDCQDRRERLRREGPRFGF